jgi:hypothetical protein
MYDSWGTSWGAVSAWGVSWVHTTPPPVVVVIDTHDGIRKNIEDYKRRKEELHENILRAFEEVTGVRQAEVTPAEIDAAQKVFPAERLVLKRIKDEALELREVNESILRAMRMLQDREMEDIAFIVSVL